MKNKITIPKSGFKDFIINLASYNKVEYKKTGYGELADNFTRLSDDKVEQDDVERLVIALKRNNVLNSKQMLSLLHGYLKETLNV